MAACLHRILADNAIERLTVVVAWTRFRGLARLRPELEGFRARGGTTRLIVGIDEGGATRPGLLLACKLFDEPSVFHDRAGGTFHPKIYLAEGPEQAVLMVGSSNATPGGWFSNYEASLEVRFALPDESEHPALAAVRSYLGALEGEDELLRPLTEELVDRLVEDRAFNVSGHEQRSRRLQTPPSEDAGAADVDASGSLPVLEGGDELFGGRRSPRPVLPPLSEADKLELTALELPVDDEAEADEPLSTPEDEPEREATPPAPPTARGGRRGPAPALAARWSKVLPRGDAQHPAPGSNPTGNVRLTKARHDIDWRTWFRRTLFSPATWRHDVDRQGNRIERATIPFDVTIAGISLGTISLDVTHAPHRESGQANHTTVLHWGPLMSVVRSTDYTRNTLTLERHSDGSYKLDLS